MEIKVIKVGDLETNCYILTKNKQAIVIDPGDEVEKINLHLSDVSLVGIIVTHHHFDHVGALRELASFKNAKIYDFHNLKVGKNRLGNFEFEVIRTPGHKEDSICIYFKEESVMFSGDFIFNGTVGRWDLEGGNFDEMKVSIRKILEYPSDIVIYPGHGEKTTLGSEKVNLEKYLKYF